MGSGLLCPCPHGLTPGCDGASAPVSARGGAGTQAGRAETGEGALAAAMHSWRDMGCEVPGARRVRGPAGPAAPTHIQECCSSRSLHQQQKSERGQGRWENRRGCIESWEPAGNGSCFIFSVVLVDTIPPNLPVTQLQLQDRARGSWPPNISQHITGGIQVQGLQGPQAQPGWGSFPGGGIG